MSRSALTSRLRAGGRGATETLEEPPSAAKAAANFGCLRTAAQVSSQSDFRFIGKRKGFGTLTPTVSMPPFCGLHCTPSTSSKSSAAADIAGSHEGGEGRHAATTLATTAAADDADAPLATQLQSRNRRGAAAYGDAYQRVKRARTQDLMLPEGLPFFSPSESQWGASLLRLPLRTAR